MSKEEDLDLYELLPREEISAFKQSVANSKGGLREATKQLQQPDMRLRAKHYSTTRRLYKVWVILGYSHAFFIIVLPIVLFFLARWYWALASILLDIFIIQTIHNAVNLELYTRICLTNKWMDEFDERMKKPPQDTKTKNKN